MKRMNRTMGKPGGMMRHGGNRNYKQNTTQFNGAPDRNQRRKAYDLNQKFLTLGRDAMSAGDRVMAEYHFQHAEHFFRVVKEFDDADVAYQATRSATREERPREQSQYRDPQEQSQYLDPQAPQEPSQYRDRPTSREQSQYRDAQPPREQSQYRERNTQAPREREPYNDQPYRQNPRDNRDHYDSYDARPEAPVDAAPASAPDYPNEAEHAPYAGNPYGSTRPVRTAPVTQIAAFPSARFPAQGGGAGGCQFPARSRFPKCADRNSKTPWPSAVTSCRG